MNLSVSQTSSEKGGSLNSAPKIHSPSAAGSVEKRIQSPTSEELSIVFRRRRSWDSPF